ncbi:MAG: CBS domain-containing protein [Gammaproteobacteria bacterium]|nr:CBS domain-containing protein [Gammaproteobacteria bacterium]
MTAGGYCNREVVVTDPDTPVAEVAKLMRSHHVGSIVVTEKKDGNIIPIGILTDRDIVVEVIARDVLLESVLAKDAMSREVITVTEDTTLLDSLELMKTKGVRRLPVINSAGGLEGLLSADDAIELLSEAMNDLVILVKQETRLEQNLHP